MGKVIAIKAENQGKLQALLKHEQKRCTARTISLFALEAIAETAEKRLQEMGVSPSARAGCRRDYLEAVPNSYDYAAMGTRVVIRRLSTGYWGLEVVSRERSPHQAGGGVRDNLFLTAQAKHSALTALMREHGVRDMPATAA